MLELSVPARSALCVCSLTPSAVTEMDSEMRPQLERDRPNNRAFRRRQYNVLLLVFLEPGRADGQGVISRQQLRKEEGSGLIGCQLPRSTGALIHQAHRSRNDGAATRVMHTARDLACKALPLQRWFCEDEQTR